MRVKKIALWVLAAILAAVLFYLFRDEMALQTSRHVSLPALPIVVPVVS